MPTPMVTREQAHEINLHHFAADASDLGLRAGSLPHTMATDIGNGEPWILVRATIQAFEYTQSMGICRLTVFND